MPESKSLEKKSMKWTEKLPCDTLHNHKIRPPRLRVVEQMKKKQSALKG